VIKERVYYAAPLDGIMSVLVHETKVSYLALLKIPRGDIA
jgi:hypothetical protein